MKQVLQELATGKTVLTDVPAPGDSRGALRIATRRSLISAGTERMLIDFGRAGWIERARQQHDRVRMVLDKVRTDGLVPTIEAVRNKLDQPIPMGYCNVGVVVGVGEGVTGFAIGDRVISNGKHAEVVSVPVNLCAKVPVGVDDDAAAFAVLGAIALQGIRLVHPTIGETVVVTGLGLVGLLAVQILRANGCRVLGVDFDSRKLELARRFGAETVDLGAGVDPVAAADEFSRGRGVDAVMIAASTSSSEPVHQAALMCRKRGRIVLVGVTGLELSRADFYEKELTFQVSCSYGPGRYDSLYEEKGEDYPVGFVRWTEQRNFEAVLDLLASGSIDAAPLVSHRVPIEDAPAAYEIVGGKDSSLGILLTYGPEPSASSPMVARSVALVAAQSSLPAAANIALIGSGNYATAVLIPAFRRAGAGLHSVVSASGVSSVHAARKYGFRLASTDAQAAIVDAAVDAVVIATRHDSHAALVLSALAAGKHVFVEKPLCLSIDELERIAAAAVRAGRILMVGFNRRFAPQVVRMRGLLDRTSGAKAFVMTVNAGAVPAGHWVQDAAVGGGRLLGEGCHFIDLLRHLADSPITGHHAVGMVSNTRDSASIVLNFEDGSIGAIHYLANGHKRFPKERLEVFAAGRILRLDNFRRLQGFGWSNFKSMNLWRQDKGQSGCAGAFVEAVRNGAQAPIPLEQILEVSRVSIEIQQALR